MQRNVIFIQHPQAPFEISGESYLPSFLNFLTGVGGVLYPPNSLHQDILSQEGFSSLCPNADDIWFWAMAVLADTKISLRLVFLKNHALLQTALQIKAMHSISLMCYKGKMICSLKRFYQPTLCCQKKSYMHTHNTNNPYTHNGIHRVHIAMARICHFA